jgi:hypothetical protein
MQVILLILSCITLISSVLKFRLLLKRQINKIVQGSKLVVTEKHTGS